MRAEFVYLTINNRERFTIVKFGHWWPQNAVLDAQRWRVSAETCPLVVVGVAYSFFFGSTITLRILVAVVEVMLAVVVEVPLEAPFLFRLDVGGSAWWWWFSSCLPANGGSKVLLLSFTLHRWLLGGFIALIATGLAFKWTLPFRFHFHVLSIVGYDGCDVCRGGRCSSGGSLTFQIKF